MGDNVLIRFRVENHRSIRDEQELSFVASPISDGLESVVNVERYNLKVLRLAGVYGSNASGKSALFDSLGFMRHAVLESQRTWAPDGGVPRTPFALDPAYSSEPSLFSVDILVNGVRYEYGFRVDSTRVVEEWLFAFPRGRRQEWFTRDATRDLEFAFSRLLPGENRAISSLTRTNSLFLSAAAQNNHEMLGPIYQWFSQKLWVVNEEFRSYFEGYTVELCRDGDGRASILSVLAAADLGISNIEYIEAEIPANIQQLIRTTDDPNVADVIKRLYDTPRVRFWHSTGIRGRDVALPFDQESRGTRTLFSLLGILNWSLTSGSTLVVDELDQSLHTNLARGFAQTFNDLERNPWNAQLLFSTHDTNLLDGDLLRRDQVWFTEKGMDGATRLVPLTDFHARKDENLERGYLQGRYGAVPSIRSSGFNRIAEG